MHRTQGKVEYMAYKKLGYEKFLSMFGATKRLSWRRQKQPCYWQLFLSHCLAGISMFIHLTEYCARFTKTATQLKSHFREMEEISIFVKDAICNDQCLGRCLYIHGVPGTGKVLLFLWVLLWFYLICRG